MLAVTQMEFWNAD